MTARLAAALLGALLPAAAAALPRDDADASRRPTDSVEAQRLDVEIQVQALSDPKQRAEAWGRLGMLYHARRMRLLAQDAYERALAENETPRWRYLRGVVLAEQGEVERSVADFRRTLALEPDYLAAGYRLGTALLLAGDLDGAEEALSAARELDPSSALILSALADVAAERGDGRRALDLLESAWRLEPSAGQLAYKIALAQRRLGEPEAAADWLARDPGNRLAPTIDDPLLLEVAQTSVTPRFYEMAAEWALARGDLAAAVTAFGNAVSLAPEDASLRLRLASALARREQPAEALLQLRTLLELEPASAPGWRLLARLLGASADPEILADASLAAARSLELEDDPDTRAMAAGLAMRRGSFDEAGGHYQALADGDPGEATYLYWLGLAQLGSGDCGGVEPLRRAVELRGNWGEAHLVLARAEALCGDAAAAVARAEALLRARDDADTRLTLAFAMLAAGDGDEAARIAEGERPHADAVLLLDAIAAGVAPAAPFAPESAWWLP